MLYSSAVSGLLIQKVKNSPATNKHDYDNRSDVTVKDSDMMFKNCEDTFFSSEVVLLK